MQRLIYTVGFGVGIFIGAHHTRIQCTNRNVQLRKLLSEEEQKSKLYKDFINQNYLYEDFERYISNSNNQVKK